MRGDPVAPARCRTADLRFGGTITRMRAGGVVLVLAMLVPGSPGAAQQPDSHDSIYRREVFKYRRDASTDPFRSRLGTVETERRSGGLLLRGIVYSEDPRESVAILAEEGSNRRIRARVGERVGPITLVGIFPRRVDLVVEELGARRRQSLLLKVDRDPTPGS